jgi:hypothetical protein
MKTIVPAQRGSILAITLLTMTVLTMVCATSLYITSQNSSTTMQTTSWQQALDAAESAMNWGISAMNNQAQGNANPWQGWWAASSPMPRTQPPCSSFASNGSCANAPAQANGSPQPNGSNYNYLIPANVTSVGEGSNAISGWVMVDTGGGILPLVSIPGLSTAQWYRMRATGVAYISGLRRVSNDKLDSNLRNTISLLVDRKSGVTIPTANPQYRYDQAPQVTRTIEVIMQPVSSQSTAYTSLTKNQFNTSGGATVHGDIAIMDTRKLGNTGTTSNSDLKSSYIYGNLTYSGPPVANTGHVQGNISTPFTAPSPTPAGDPSWLPGILPTQYTSMSFSGGQTVTAGSLNTTQATSKKIKVSGGGDLTVSSGTLTFAPYVDSSSGLPVESYFEIWVPGQLTVSGGSKIEQQAHVHLTFYVDDKMTVSGGSSMVNDNNAASYLTINGNWQPSNPNSYTPLAATFSGGSGFYGLVNAPFYAFAISGGSAYHGSWIGDSMNVSGGGTEIWEDSSLNTGVSNNGNYAYASWFEDNSDVGINPQTNQSVVRNIY